jgi:hypothetical protein
MDLQILILVLMYNCLWRRESEISPTSQAVKYVNLQSLMGIDFKATIKY